ncbi:MAG TPA: exodeoxyribonuclease V subunit gamma [Acidimicrobiales bacterium]|nr:exodeoxyribonuclease V subunit gamma [Acidimicrobiales bacterium]
MMHLYAADRARPLAIRLAGVLAEPQEDALAPEWLAVPSDGMRRWLLLELARHLGASFPGSGDGIAANFVRAYPGSLRSHVLNVERADPTTDPWGIGRLVWSVLTVTEQRGGDPGLRDVTGLAPGASAYARARRVADLFDRYHLHRPDMIRQWADGTFVDGIGQRIADHHVWQPRLWRLVREHVGEDSPPERLPMLLDSVRDGTLPLGLPERLVLFGLSVLPGPEFVELARAVAAQVDVHLFLLEPAAFDGARLYDLFPPPARAQPKLRSNDPTAEAIEPPLLRSWGRLARETALLLADARVAGLPAPERPEVGSVLGTETRTVTDNETARDAPPPTLLERLQRQLRTAGRAGDVPATVDPSDRSVQFHACYGPIRQVQVARDALLHLLNQPGSQLAEEDVLVLCPSLERFAPLIEAVFGPSTDLSSPPSPTPDLSAGEGRGAPTLRYRIADQSIRSTNPVLAAAAALLELASGRFASTEVLDFFNLNPVRESLGLDDDDLSTITEWVEDTYVRWGLDPAQRTRFGVPDVLTGNTWEAALDRLLLGTAVEDTGLGLAIGDVAPFGVEGSDMDTLGRLAGALGHLATLEAQVGTPRPIGEWVPILRRACQALLAAPRGAEWQVEALHRIFGEVLDASTQGTASTVPLTFVDVRHLFDERLNAEVGRPDFFRGGITVTSLTPLRWIPYRVICILGMDQTAFGTPAAAADDLVATAPLIGDRDPRAEARQALLEAVLAASDHLVVTRDGRDVRTNRPVPRSVAASELFEAVVASVAPEDRPALTRRLEVDHPRHPFDEPCFLADGLLPGVIWGFSPTDLDGASARRTRVADDRPFLTSRLEPPSSPVIDIADLRSFLEDPVKTFVTRALDVGLPRSSEALSSLLPVELTPLEHWGAGNRLLHALLDGADVGEWLEVERVSGALPPGVLEHTAVDNLRATVELLLAEADGRGLRRGPPEQRELDVELADRTRIVGTVDLRLAAPAAGPVRLQFSRVKPVHQLLAWLDLMALVATDPGGPWRSVLVGRPSTGSAGAEVVDLVPPASVGDGMASARAALEVVVDCCRRGMREPLPIFPTLSLAVHRGKASSALWSSHNGRGDARDDWVRTAFGDIDFDGIMALEARPDDPAGSGGRVERYAGYLWGEFDRSATVLDGAGSS